MTGSNAAVAAVNYGFAEIQLGGRIGVVPAVMFLEPQRWGLPAKLDVGSATCLPVSFWRNTNAVSCSVYFIFVMAYDSPLSASLPEISGFNRFESQGGDQSQ